MYGQPLLDLATFKIIMGTDGQNLEETRNLYNLTDAEEELIMSKKRGSALMIVGSKRLNINLKFQSYSLIIWEELEVDKYGSSILKHIILQSIKNEENRKRIIYSNSINICCYFFNFTAVVYILSSPFKV